MYFAVESKLLRYLEFCHSMTLSLLTSQAKSRLQIEEVRINVLPNKVRYDGINHIIAPQERCKFYQKNTQNMC